MKKQNSFLIRLLFVPLLFTACENSKNKSNSVEQKDSTNSPKEINNSVENAIPITDIDGNSYKTIKIGTQIWMAENLKVTKYRNGDPISNNLVADWTNSTSGAWCYYKNDSKNNALYGKLYNWYAVNDSRGICPIGWHVPTDTEYTVLENYLGGRANAGGQMKEKGTAHWISSNTGATNTSGFTALPGGFAYDDSFRGVGSYGSWWASTAGGCSAWGISLDCNSAQVYLAYSIKSHGCSVRCIKDSKTKADNPIITNVQSTHQRIADNNAANGTGTSRIVTDIDGNTYKTIKIGTQVWMAENLKVTKYRNGDPIPNVTYHAKWIDLTEGAWCYYDNYDIQNNAIYGKLYNWYAVNDNRGISPEGWHVPSNAEWTVLENYLGGRYAAGGKMKESGTTHWDSPNTGATNGSGFTALPGGNSNGGPSYPNVRFLGGWWSATVSGRYIWHCELFWDIAEMRRSETEKWHGLSVRCVKD